MFAFTQKALWQFYGNFLGSTCCVKGPMLVRDETFCFLYLNKLLSCILSYKTQCLKVDWLFYIRFWVKSFSLVKLTHHLLPLLLMQLLQQLKRLICDLCRLYNLPQHPDVEMLDQPLPAGPISQDKKVTQISTSLHSLFTLLSPCS